MSVCWVIHARSLASSHELKESGWSQWKASGHVGHFFTEQKRTHFSQNRNKLNFHWRRRWWLRSPQRVREQSLASPELRCTLFTDSKVSLAVLARKRHEKRSSGCALPNGGFLCFLCKPENTENPPPWCTQSGTIILPDADGWRSGSWISYRRHLLSTVDRCYAPNACTTLRGVRHSSSVLYWSESVSAHSQIVL